MFKLSRNPIAILTLVSVLSACGGRDAVPVLATQYGDNKKSCPALEFELANAQSEIQRLVGQRDKTGKNVVLGVTGFFLIVPLFFMDFKNAEAQEYEAYRQRYNHLAAIAMDKKCDVVPVELPSAQQLQKEYESQQLKKGG